MQKKGLPMTLDAARNAVRPGKLKTGEAETPVFPVRTARCIRQFALHAVKRPRFLSSLAETDRFTAGTVISRVVVTKL